MKKATFEYMQKLYANQCNLYWFRLQDLYKKSGLTRVTFEQFYEWEKNDKELLEHKTVMDELFYICHLEDKKNELNDQPTAKFAKDFMNKFYNEIYQTEG